MRLYEPVDDVREWHTVAGVQSFADLDRDGRDALILLRRTLICEETDEVYDELTNFVEDDGGGRWPSRARLAKELADMLYVIYGTADLMDIDLPAVFQLVHDNNMTKVNAYTGKVERRYDGKILKPDNFRELTEDEINDVINLN